MVMMQLFKVMIRVMVILLSPRWAPMVDGLSGKSADTKYKGYAAICQAVGMFEMSFVFGLFRYRPFFLYFGENGPQHQCDVTARLRAI